MNDSGGILRLQSLLAPPGEHQAGHRHGAEHRVQVSGRQSGVAQVQPQAARVGEIHRRPGRHRGHQGGVVGEHEGDPQKQEHRQDQQGAVRTVPSFSRWKDCR